MVFGTNPPIERLDPLSMPEAEFTSQDIMKNPVLISSFKWDTTSDPLTELQSFSIPSIVVSTASFHQLMLKTYAYYRPEFTIRVQVNSTKFHVGRLACWYSPFNQHNGTVDYTSKKAITRPAITGLTHAMIDASLSNVVEFPIPFEHIQTALTTNSDDTLNEMGKYHITVFNKLKAASGSTTKLTVNVYLSAALIKLHVPLHVHTPTVFAPSPYPLKAQGFIGDIIGSAKPILENGSSAIFNVLTGNYSQAAGSAGKTFNGVSSLLKTFNLDKPTNPLNGTENMLNRPAPLAHCNGVDSSVRLGNSSLGGYLCHTEFSSTTEREMSIDNLIKIPMFCKNISWTQSQPVNTVLLTIPISPSYCEAVDESKVTYYGKYLGDEKFSTKQVTTSYYIMNNTYLSYLSSMFVFWRGPIKFRFDVVSSQFHTGRLGLQFVPNHDKTNASTYTLIDRSQDPLTIFDIHEQKSIEVEIPYFSSTMSKIWAPLTTTYGASGGQDYLSDNNIIGYLHVYVQNALAAPSNVPSDVEINVYISAGENFELDVLGPKPQMGAKRGPDVPAVGVGNNLPLTPVRFPIPDKVKPTTQAYPLKAQMQAVPTRSEEAAQQVTQSRTEKATVPAYNRFGDRLTDVREIGRRFVRSGIVWIKLDTITVDSGEAETKNEFHTPKGSNQLRGSATIAVTPLVGVAGDRDTSNTTFNNSELSYRDYSVCSAGVARIFATWHGSMRYKIIPVDGRYPQGNLEVNYVPDWNAWTPIKSFYSRVQDEVDEGRHWDWTSYPSVVTVNNQNAGLEVEVPYYSSYQQLVVEGNDGGKPRTFISGVLKLTYTSFDFAGTKYGSEDKNRTDGYPVIGFHVYQALGDDFSFGFPVSPPSTYFHYRTEIKDVTSESSTHQSKEKDNATQRLGSHLSGSMPSIAARATEFLNYDPRF